MVDVSTKGGIAQNHPLIGSLAPTNYDNGLRGSVGNESKRATGVPTDGDLGGHIALNDPKFFVRNGADILYLGIHIERIGYGRRIGGVLKEIGANGEGTDTLGIEDQGP